MPRGKGGDVAAQKVLHPGVRSIRDLRGGGPGLGKPACANTRPTTL